MGLVRSFYVTLIFFLSSPVWATSQFVQKEQSFDWTSEEYSDCGQSCLVNKGGVEALSFEAVREHGLMRHAQAQIATLNPNDRNHDEQVREVVNGIFSNPSFGSACIESYDQNGIQIERESGIACWNRIQLLHKMRSAKLAKSIDINRGNIAKLKNTHDSGLLDPKRKAVGFGYRGEEKKYPQLPFSPDQKSLDLTYQQLQKKKNLERYVSDQYARQVAALNRKGPSLTDFPLTRQKTLKNGELIHEVVMECGANGKNMCYDVKKHQQALQAFNQKVWHENHNLMNLERRRRAQALLNRMNKKVRVRKLKQDASAENLAALNQTRNLFIGQTNAQIKKLGLEAPKNDSASVAASLNEKDEEVAGTQANVSSVRPEVSSEKTELLPTKKQKTRNEIHLVLDPNRVRSLSDRFKVF